MPSNWGAQAVSTTESELEKLQRQIDDFQAEKNSPLAANTLSEQERAHLRALEEEHRNLLRAQESAEAQLVVVSAERDRLTADLQNNLLKRKEELELTLLAAATSSTATSAASRRDFEVELAALEVELKHVSALRNAVEGELREIAEQNALKKEETATLERLLDKKRAQEVSDSALYHITYQLIMSCIQSI